MAFCILRMEKLKSAVSLRRAVQHNARERHPLNADAALSVNNWSTGNSDEVMQKYHDKLPEKVRSNAVHAVEILMTASPEFKGNWDGYLKDCANWAVKLFGRENVLHVANHNDESTPHCHVLVIPLKDGKLNAKHFIGGSRDRMRELQDDFYQNTGNIYGLERGQPKAETKARHTPHTLAAAAADLEKKKSIMVAAAKELQINPVDFRKMKDRLARLDAMTPNELRLQAKMIESEGFKNVKEYRAFREAENEREAEKKRKLVTTR